MKKIKNIDYSIAILIFVHFLWMLFWLCTGIHYETEDDWAIASIAMGLWGPADYHLVYSNVILGKLYVWLFRLWHNINWYTVFLLLVSFTSINVILVKVYQRAKNIYLKIAFVFVSLCISIQYYYFLQYTRVAGIAAIAAIILWLDTYENNIFETDKKRAIICYFLAGLLFVLSFWLRFAIAGAVGVIFAPVIIAVFVKSFGKSQKIKGAIGFWCLVGIICVMSYLVDMQAYSSKDWREYKDFSSVRTQITDYGWPEYAWPDYYLYQDKYEDVGLSESAYNAFVKWNFADSNVITTDTLRKINSFKRHESVLSVAYIKECLATVKNMLSYQFAFVCIGTVVFAIIFFKGKHRLYFGLSILIVCLIEAYFIYVGRVRIRVDVSFFVSLAVMAMYYGYEEIRWNKNVVKWAVAIVSILAILYQAKNVMFTITHMEKEQQYENDSIQYQIANDKNHMYIARMSENWLINWKEVYDTYPEEFMSNYQFAGFWTAYSPIYNTQLAEYGVSNAYKDLIDNESMLLIDSDKSSVDDVELYLQEYYDSSVHAVLEQNIADFNIYKFTTGEE